MPLRKWTEFLDGVPAGQPLRQVILESWHRSVDAGVDVSAETLDVPRVSPDDLARRQRDAAVMLEVATPHLEWLSGAIGVPHVVYVADRDGVILHAVGSGFDLEHVSLAPGFVWSEEAAGTNGAGTAIAANRPVAIVGSEHIVKAFHGFTCTGSPLHDARGEVIGAIDVSTSAKDGGPERLVPVAHAAFSIDRELAQRQALASAEAATSARDRLLAEVSHEVRTPLTAIVGWAQLVRANASMLDDGLAEIESSAWRLSVLVADLLEMSRIATGRMTLERAEIDLCAVTSTVAGTMQAIAAKRGVSLEVSVAAPVVISGDRRRLEQVITNLLSNAVKFTPAGGTIAASVAAQEGAARLVVRDTGRGIEPQLLPFVFDYLRQGEPRGGLGLGLAIVREIVALHGGTVIAESDGAGKGATLTVELPLLVTAQVREAIDEHRSA